MTDVAESQLSDLGSSDDLYDEFLGALAALGGSTGNGRLRDVLEWDGASFDAVKAELLNRGVIVPGRGRGGSVVLADADGGGARVPIASAGDRPARRPRAARGSGGTRASSASASGFETAFRAIDDCLRQEAGCGTELDDTEQTSWLLFLNDLDGLEDDRAALAALEGRSPSSIMNKITSDNHFDSSQFTDVDATEQEASKSSLRDGDFLFYPRNSHELVGKSCIDKSASNVTASFNNNMMRVRFKAGVDARFALLAFSLRYVFDQLNTLNSGTTNVLAIYFKDLKSLAFPIRSVDVRKAMAKTFEALSEETQRLTHLCECKTRRPGGTQTIPPAAGLQRRALNRRPELAGHRP